MKTRDHSITGQVFDKHVEWLDICDPRGGRIGITESSPDHPNCIDIIGDYNNVYTNGKYNGYIVFVRIKRCDVGKFLERMKIFLVEWDWTDDLKVDLAPRTEPLAEDGRCL